MTRPFHYCDEEDFNRLWWHLETIYECLSRASETAIEAHYCAKGIERRHDLYVLDHCGSLVIREGNEECKSKVEFKSVYDFIGMFSPKCNEINSLLIAGS